MKIQNLIKEPLKGYLSLGMQYDLDIDDLQVSNKLREELFNISTKSIHEKKFILYKLVQQQKLTKDKTKKDGAQYAYITLNHLLNKLHQCSIACEIELSEKESDSGKHRIELIDAKTGELIKYSECDELEQITGNKSLSNAQISGQGQTYTRRYHLLKFFSLSPDEDKDAEPEITLTKEQIQKLVIAIEVFNYRFSNINAKDKELNETPSSIKQRLQQIDIGLLLAHFNRSKLEELSNYDLEKFETILKNRYEALTYFEYKNRVIQKIT